MRFGGREIEGRFMFECTGGAPALDFLNTLDERRASPRERLTGYGVLVDWAVQARLLPAPLAERLLAGAARDPAGVARVLAAAVALRELLFAAVERVVADEPIPDGMLAELNGWVAQASAQRRLAAGRAGPEWSWGDGGESGLVLWLVVEDAARILVSADLRGRLRICRGPTCAWAFLDFSRTRNRRWCDMTVCGNRTKARRHYERTRKSEGKP